jgi:hypothetical protein
MNEKMLQNQNNNLPDMRLVHFFISLRARWDVISEHFSIHPISRVCLFYPICHAATARSIIPPVSHKIEINSSALLTLHGRCQTIFPWENINIYPGAKPYFVRAQKSAFSFEAEKPGREECQPSEIK